MFLRKHIPLRLLFFFLKDKYISNVTDETFTRINRINEVVKIAMNDTSKVIEILRILVGRINKFPDRFSGGHAKRWKGNVGGQTQISGSQ